MSKLNKVLLIKTGRKLIATVIVCATIITSCFLFSKANSIETAYFEDSVQTLAEEIKDNQPITRFDNAQDWIAITIECETSNSDIDEIITLLDKYNVKASFFITGVWAEKYKDEVRLIESKGHDICCHGFTHLKLSTLNTGAIREELNHYKNVVADILQMKEWRGYYYFRAPYSETENVVLKTSGEQGYRVYNDEINALDWKNDISVNEIMDHLKQNITQGDIVTLHSGHTKSPTVLAELLKYCKDSKLNVKSLSEIEQLNK